MVGNKVSMVTGNKEDGKGMDASSASTEGEDKPPTEQKSPKPVPKSPINTEAPAQDTAESKIDNKPSTEKEATPDKSAKKQKLNGAVDISTAKRMELLAQYKEALIRREEACRELERLEKEAKSSDLPLLDDYAKDPIYLPVSSDKDSQGDETRKTVTPHGLNSEARKLEQFFPPQQSALTPSADGSAGAASSSVAQVVQQAAHAVSSHQNPALLHQMQALQDQQQIHQQQQLQHQYAAQQSLAVQQQLQHQHGFYQSAPGQPLYGTATAAQTDPSMLLLAAQYQQAPTNAAPGAMYLPAGAGFTPVAGAPGLHLSSVVPSAGAAQVGDAGKFATPSTAGAGGTRSSPERAAAGQAASTSTSTGV